MLLKSPSPNPPSVKSRPGLGASRAGPSGRRRAPRRRGPSRRCSAPCRALRRRFRRTRRPGPVPGRTNRSRDVRHVHLSAPRFRGLRLGGDPDPDRDRDRTDGCAPGGGGGRWGLVAASAGGNPSVTHAERGGASAGVEDVRGGDALVRGVPRPAASEAHAASKGYSCKTARDRGSPTDAGRCGTALSHLLARCCMRPNTDFFARGT